MLLRLPRQPNIRKLSVRNVLPEELSFISEYRRTNPSFRAARWLTSRFEEPVWHCLFGKSTIIINFAITLTDGTVLTDRKNAKLLDCIKRFLCLQTHPSLIGGKTFTLDTQKAAVSRAIHVVDHFLLRGCFVATDSSDFTELTKNDIFEFLDVIASNRLLKSSMYEPERRVLEFIRSVSMSSKDLDALQRRVPLIFDTVDCQLPEEIDENRVQLARAWLYSNGFYSNAGPNEPFKHCLSLTRLLDYLIGEHVLGRLKFDDVELEYLDFLPRELFIRELRAVPVQAGSEDERAGSEYVMSYFQTLRSMGVVNESGPNLVPEDALTALDEEALLKHGRLKQKGRFTTLPFEVANRSLGTAIEFFLEYGDALVDQYLNMAKQNWQGSQFDFVLPEPLQRLGVRQFENCEPDRDAFFSNLRKGASLYQMLQVLIGAILILVNTLMARRSSELLKLTRESIVKDGIQFFLAFDLSKAGVGTLRKRTLRPLPAIGADGLALLHKLNVGLKQLGYTSTDTLIPNLPLTKKDNFIAYGSTRATRAWMKQCLDRFCDYVGMPGDSQGRRYYIRPHQLRRNFAMLFFWRGSFGGIEILQYFLGHQKPSITYRYVSESVTGKVLRQVKAEVATALIKSNNAATESLAQLICQRYGVDLDELHILPEGDVIAYVEDLLMNGEAEIEPEFIDGPNGEQYKVLYKVRAPRSAEETE